MDDLKKTASDLLARGQEQAKLLAKHGPGAVRDGIASYEHRVAGQDAGPALASWNDTPTRTAIVDFVAAVTTEGSADYIAPEARIAVFDNDGTLWPEKPLVIQLAFTLQRFGEMAEADESLRDQQPYKAVYDKDFGWLNEAIAKHYRGDDADMGLLLKAVPSAFTGLTIEAYQASAKAFFDIAPHPTLNRPYASLGYKPMVELFRYLEANGFTVYIASGGERDFMRSIANEIYGIPPERVVGSSLKLKFDEHEDSVDVIYQGEMEFFDDGPEKPVRIWSRLGRRPVIAGGNSNGDIAMMRFANIAERKSLRLLVHHDDAEREFAYDDGAEDALARAAERGWTVVSMKDDWSTIFTEQPTVSAQPEPATPAPEGDAA